MRGLLISLACSLGLSACAYTVTDMPSAPYDSLQRETRIQTGDILVKYLAAQRRLWTVAGPMMIANAPLCPRRTVTPGFTVLSDFDLPKNLQDVAYERALLSRDAVVQSVYGQDAFAAGVRAGDVLLSVDGKRVRNAADFRARMKRRAGGESVTYGFLREGAAYTLTLPLVDICRYRLVYLAADREINAWTDGATIYVTQGQMDFANDRELAVVFGHELAHNVMNHTQKMKLNSQVITTIGHWTDNAFDVVGFDTDFEGLSRAALSEIYGVRFEREADYAGLYLLARAGGDITAAAPYWRRIAAEHGMDSVRLPLTETRSHPDDPERFVTLEKTRIEIEDKIRTGRELMPNLSRGYTYGQKFFWWERDNDDADDEPDDRDLNH